MTTPLPKEHGATVMFLTCLTVGAVVGESFGRSSLAMLLVLSGAFLLREPAVQLARRGRLMTPSNRRVHLMAATLALGLVVVGGLQLAALGLSPTLLLLLGIGGALFALTFAATVLGRAWCWWADSAGVVAAVLATPAMILAARGRLDRGHLELTTVMLLFLLGSTLHLRTILRNGPRFRDPRSVRPGLAALWSLASVAVAALLGLLGSISAGLAVAAAIALLRPVFLRGAILQRIPRVGLAESALTVAFAVALVVAA